MSGRRAIVTLAVGDGYAERWRRLCEPSWRAYAERHGYELICLQRPLDDSRRAAGRSPSWQKLLVCEQPFASDYERIVWVDADVVFGEEAPDVCAGVPPDKVGAVDEFEAPTPEVKRRVYGSLLEGYYAAAGLDREHDQVVQAGVLVLSPAHHAELLRRVYDEYEDIGLNYEMRPLSHELLSAGLVHWLDPRFNRLWDVQRAHRHPYLLDYPRHPRARQALAEALAEVHCLHFAGRSQEMEELLGERAEPPAAARSAGPTPRVRAPVALLMFARPDTTELVLDAVRRARPERLFLIADAARSGDPEEAELCERTRALTERVDWDCDVSTEFADEHLGLTRRVESGLDRVFGQVEEAIVLEDDTIPDPTFFRFCDELLDRYRDAERVMSVGGTNLQFAGPASADSYYFSRYPPGPGFATWRRAWERYDPEMAAWPRLRGSDWLRDKGLGGNAAVYWSQVLEQAHRERDHWDRIWLFSCWLHGGVHAVANVNLIANVGFRADGTNVGAHQRGLFGDLPTVPIAFPLTGPDRIAVSDSADAFTDRLLYSGWVTRMLQRVRAANRIGVPAR